MLPVSRAGAAPDSRPARLLMALLLLAVLAFVVSTIPGVRAATGFVTVGFDQLMDGWLQGGGYIIAAALALLRPFASRVDRAIWAWQRRSRYGPWASSSSWRSCADSSRRRSRRWPTPPGWRCTC